MMPFRCLLFAVVIVLSTGCRYYHVTPTAQREFDNYKPLDKPEDRGRFCRALEGMYSHSPESLFQLGKCFEMGDGVARDSGKAVAFYRWAAGCGHVEAGNRLISMGFDPVTPKFREGDRVRSRDAERGEDGSWHIDSTPTGFADCGFMAGDSYESDASRNKRTFLQILAMPFEAVALMLQIALFPLFMFNGH